MSGSAQEGAADIGLQDSEYTTVSIGLWNGVLDSVRELNCPNVPIKGPDGDFIRADAENIHQWLQSYFGDLGLYESIKPKMIWLKLVRPESSYLVLPLPTPYAGNAGVESQPAKKKKQRRCRRKEYHHNYGTMQTYWPPMPQYYDYYANPTVISNSTSTYFNF